MPTKMPSPRKSTKLLIKELFSASLHPAASLAVYTSH